MAVGFIERLWLFERGSLRAMVRLMDLLESVSRLLVVGWFMSLLLSLSHAV